jgi:hypothetical protein
LTGEVVLRDPTIDDFRNAAAKHDRPDPEAERRFGIKTKPPTTTANRAVFLAKLAKEVESISPEVPPYLMNTLRRRKIPRWRILLYQQRLRQLYVSKGKPQIFLENKKRINEKVASTYLDRQRFRAIGDAR